MICYMAIATMAIGLLAASPRPSAWEASYGKALEASRADKSPLLVVLDDPHSEEERIEPALLSTNSPAGKQAELLRPYRLCHVDVTTEYGQKVAKAFQAKSFPHVAIIDKTGSSVIFRKTGKIDAAEWEKALTLHRNGERTARAVSHVTYKPVSSPEVYGGSMSGSYCPSCQRQSRTHRLAGRTSGRPKQGRPLWDGSLNFTMGEAINNAALAKAAGPRFFMLAGYAGRARSGPGWMSSERSSNNPARKRSTAIAPMTALSVQSYHGGIYHSYLR
jgi:hypothetical protein